MLFRSEILNDVTFKHHTIDCWGGSPDTIWHGANGMKVVGDTNTFNINQASTGANGSSIWIDLAGSNNTMTISQTGSIDNVLNIKSVANSGTFNITQKN